MRLTKPVVAKLALPPGKTDWLIFDDALAGFGLRIRAGGKRTWFAQYRIGTKQRRYSLGTTENLDADAARRLAKAALSQAHLGIDPQTAKIVRREAASVTLGVVVEDFLSRRTERLKPRSFEEVERHLRRHWKPLHSLSLKDIGRSDVADRLGVIAREHGPYAANRARTSLSSFFSWAIGEGKAHENPVAGTNKATDEVSRDRVLSPEELSLAWRLAGDGDYGAIVRLLILTGQRREEVGGMRWSELHDPTLWALPAARTKNGLPHDVPLSSVATATLTERLEPSGRDYVFGTRAGPYQGWSNSKAALDARMLAALKDRHGPNTRLEPWRLHDIRRTVATRLADTVGTQPHIIEAILNHISGHKSGVAGIYNRATYAVEKRAALDAWANQIVATSGLR